jgi:hypothetical protein
MVIKMSDDIYVVVAENNLPIKISSSDSDDPFYDDKGPIVFETYTREASLSEAIAKSIRLECYGKTRVAKLVFVDVEEGVSE